MLGPVFARGHEMLSQCVLGNRGGLGGAFTGEPGDSTAGRTLSPELAGQGVPACAEVSWALSHQGLELEAGGGGNEAGMLVLRRKGEVRERRRKGRESEAQTASCFAKLKIDFSAVLFKDDSLLSTAILA